MGRPSGRVASGVSEVVVKPVDFGALTDRLHAHARGDFVATPSFAGPSGPSTTATAPTTVADDWSVPLAARMLEQQAQRGEDVGSRMLEFRACGGMTLDVPPEQVEMLLRLAVDHLEAGIPLRSSRRCRWNPSIGPRNSAAVLTRSGNGRGRPLGATSVPWRWHSIMSRGYRSGTHDGRHPR